MTAAGLNPIRLVDYDPRWPVAFRAETDRLLQAAPYLLERIEHIGSTSVPGLAAKPTIDLMGESADAEPSQELVPLLAGLDYQNRPNEFTDRLLFSRGPDGARTYNLHIVAKGTLETRNEILFRDRLRQDSDLAARYGALKRELASQRHLDPFSYSRAKTAIIVSAVNEERASRGLPPTDIWSILGPKRRGAWINAESAGSKPTFDVQTE